MTGSISVLLVYEVPGGRPFTLARTDDRTLFASVAEHVLGEAASRAEALADADQILGSVQREEVQRLCRVLGILAPELRLRTGHEQPHDPIM